MMRRKKLLSLTVPLVAGVMMFSVPAASTVMASDINQSQNLVNGNKNIARSSTEPFYKHSLATGDVIISNTGTNPCPGSQETECPGHLITGKEMGATKPNIIIVESGIHDIILEDVEIHGENYSSLCPFEIQGDAVVNLTLTGDNILKSGDGRAGIKVMSADKKVASLNIGGDGSLAVEAKVGGAGIGADGFKGCAGNITINSGNITVKGGKSCAGIGGGPMGSAGTIEITGGTVDAEGGDATVTDGISDNNAGSGIGCGGGCSSSKGTVIISGDTNTDIITAKGGNNSPGSALAKRTHGINCSVLSSNKKSATIITNGIYKGSADENDVTQMANFYGIEWDLDQEKGIVHGHAILKNDIGVNKEQTIEVNEGCSLTIPYKKEPTKDKPQGEKFVLKEGSTIKGNGTIIDPDRLESHGGKLKVQNQRVTLSEEDIRKSIQGKELVYPGKNEDLLAKVFFPLPTQREDKDAPNGQYYIIDQPTEWTATAIDDDGNESALRDAGKYVVKFKRPGYKDIVLENITVKKKPITLNMVDEASVKNIRYTGKPVRPTPIITYDKNSDEKLIEGKNYFITVSGDTTNVTKNVPPNDQPKLMITASPDINNNYTDSIVGGLPLNFSIIPASIENAEVALTSETGEPFETGEYNGKPFSPKITVTLPASAEGDEAQPLNKDTDYELNIEPNDELIDVATYIYTFSGKGNYDGEVKQQVTFTITEKPISLNWDALSVESKPYDGTPDINISGITSSDIIDDVSITATGVVLDENGNETSKVGDYKTVKITSVTLSEPKGKNYKIDPQPDGTIRELPDGQYASITAKNAPELKVDPTKCEVTGVTEDNPQFICTVKVESSGEDNYKYNYMMMDESGKIEETKTAEGTTTFIVNPKSKHTFAAYAIDGNGNPSSETGQTELIYFDLLDRDKPTFAELGFKEDEEPKLKFESDDKTLMITALLPYGDGKSLQYSFTGTKDENFLPKDGASIGDAYLKKDCESTKEYKGYVRYAPTKTHKASDYVELTGIAPQLNALPPVMTLLNEDETILEDETLKENEFIRSAKLQMTSEDQDNWEIYYTITTDGTEPPDITPGKKPTKRYSEPVNITKDTTVKAIAMDKTNILNPSNPVTETFTKVLPKLKTPSIISSNGSPFNGSTTVSIRLPEGYEEAKIYYTTDGNNDGKNLLETGKLYEGEFPIYETTTVKAIASMKDMTDSDMAKEAFTKSEIKIELNGIPNEIDPELDAETENKISKILCDEIENRLKEDDKNKLDVTGVEISQEICRYLTRRILFLDSNAFSYLNVVPYEFYVEAIVGNDWPREATNADFPKEGYPFFIKYPQGKDVSMEGNDFVIAHMFGSGKEIGNVELLKGEDIVKTPDGLKFTLKSASPIAIGWTKAVEGSPYANAKEGEDSSNDPSEEEPPLEEGPPSEEEPPSEEGPNSTPTPTSLNTNNDGNGSNTNGTGGTASVADAVRSAAATLLPKTGDTSKMVVWIVLAVACIAVIAGVQIKSKKGKGKKKH